MVRAHVLGLGAVLLLAAGCTQSSSLARRAITVETPGVQAQCVVRGEGANAFSASVAMTPDSLMVPNGTRAVFARCTSLDGRSSGHGRLELNAFGASSARLIVNMQPGAAR